MKLNHFLSFLLFSFVSLQIFCQSWTELMYDTNATFFDVQKAFNDEWGDKPYERGKGYKQFKRWEHFMQSRVDENGKLNQSWIVEHFQNKAQSGVMVMPSVNSNSSSTTPSWEIVGPTTVPDRNATWGGRRGVGRVNCIAFDPNNNNTLYIGTPAGGIWKSTDGGQNWSSNTDFLNSLGISCIEVDPSNSNIIYTGTGDRDGSNTYTIGVLKSIDAGQTWQTTGLANQWIINDIIINPTNSQNIIVSSFNDTWRSTDGGANWSQANGLVTNMNEVVFKPGDANIVYAAGKTGGVFYRSTDNGLNWTQITSGLPASFSANRGAIAVSADNPNVVYVAFTDHSNGFYGIYKSTNSGLSFTEQYRCASYSTSTPNLLSHPVDGNGSGGQGYYNFALAVNPTNENELYIGGINVWKSTDGGQNWNINTHWFESNFNFSQIHADCHSLDFQPNTGSLYACNDGGLYVSEDNGTTWQEKSNGLAISQFYDLGISKSDTDRVVLGAQDNGTFLRDSTNFAGVLGGDGMQCFIDFTNPDILFAEYQYGDLQRSLDGGISWTGIKPSQVTYNGNWETPFLMDKTYTNIIYVGYKELYKSNNAGSNWTPISSSSLTGNNNIYLIETSTDTNIVYFAVNDGVGHKVFKTTNAGNTWTDISPPVSISYLQFNDVAVHESDPNHLWVAQSNSVWESEDGGSTWTDISSGLSSATINCILHSEDNAALFLGLDNGVYKSNDTVINWSSFNNSSLPNVIVNTLEVQPITNTLYAATYGRGLWKIKLPSIYSPITDFSVVDTFSCDGIVKFNDLSSFFPSTWSWDFGDGYTSNLKNPTHTYSAAGQYDVTLTASNVVGSDSKTITNMVTVMDQNVNVQGTTVCQNASATLTANTNYNVKWYSDATAQNELASGNTYTTPLLTNSTSYYVQSYTADYPELNSGIDKNITTNTVNYLSGAGLVFNNYFNSILKSVKVYSDNNLNRRIQLLDANSTILYDTIVYTPSNSNGQVIELNFELPVQDGLTLREIQTTPSLFFNYLLTNQNYSSYPIQIDSLILITGSNYTSIDIYPFFYDWVVQRKSCKSNITQVDVAVNLAINETVNSTICNGDTYTFGGNTYSTSGTYYDTLSSANGCDSIVTLNLVVSSPATFTTNQSACGSYTWNGTTYTSSGLYSHTTTNASGCDSTATLNLTINQSTSSTFTHSTCTDYSWNGNTYNSSGVYTYTTTNALGCDSIATLNLTVSQPTASSSNLTTCNDYTWNGTTYTNSGVYTYTTTNAIGCDSIATLNLTVNQPTTSSSSQTACNDYTWNGTTYTNSGVYSYTTTNAVGCDSTANLDLTIINGSTWDTVSACNSYTWNGTNYINSGVFTETLPCGIATLHLTVSPSTNSSTSMTSCDSYSWNGTTYTNSGTYTYTTQNSNGCDSVATLNLTVNPSSTSLTSHTACDSYSWNGTTYTSSGTYSYTTTNALGCDSTANLYLNVVQQLPTPLISGDTTVNSTDVYTYTITSALSPSWEISNGTITNGQGTNSVTVNWSNTSNSGVISVFETDTNGCESDTALLSVTIDSTVSIVENEALDIKIYPNPFEHYTTVEFDNPQNDIYFIRLFDIRGRLVHQRKVNDEKVVIYKNQLNEGIYYLEIEGNYKAREIIVIQ